jgi:hypothetical protein
MALACNGDVDAAIARSFYHGLVMNLARRSGVRSMSGSSSMTLMITRSGTQVGLHAVTTHAVIHKRFHDHKSEGTAD